VVQVGDVARHNGIAVGAEIISIGGQLVGAGDYIDEEITEGTEIHWIDASNYSYVHEKVFFNKPSPALGLVLGTPARIGRVLFGSPAQESGLTGGCTIDDVNGIRIDHWSDLVGAIVSNDQSSEITFTVPTGQQREMILTARTLMEPLGIRMSALQFTEKHAMTEAVVQGARQSWIWGGRIFLTLKALFSGDVHSKNLNGPVGIVDLGRKVSEVGLGNLFFLLALISINLGVFNLLPFPILDGGHIFFLTIEGIRGRPVPERIQQSVHMVAFLLLISLALFVTYNDLMRLR
jgi:regulator of sigma E protease